MHAFTFLGHFYLIDYIADPAPFITRDVIDLQGNSIEFYRRNDKMADHARGLEVVFPPRRIRFGPFEADTRSGELRKHGIKVRLGQQTFQILLMLLDHPGEVVLREEIRLKLWPHDTVVEFDHSINAAIQKLREALGETAGDPRYIETLPRRGYRFIGTVEAPPTEPAAEPETAKAAVPPEQPRDPRSRSQLVFAVAIVLVAAGAITAWVRPWATNKPENWTLALGTMVRSVVSPDGSSVIHTTPDGLMLRRMNSLEEIPVYTAGRLVDEPAWSPDGSQVVFRTPAGLIRLPLPNGPPAVLWPRMGITRGFAWGPDGTILSAVMPDGTPDGGKLYLIGAQGGDPLGVWRSRAWRTACSFIQSSCPMGRPSCSHGAIPRTMKWDCTWRPWKRKRSPEDPFCSART